MTTRKRRFLPTSCRPMNQPPPPTHTHTFTLHNPHKATFHSTTRHPTTPHSTAPPPITHTQEVNVQNAAAWTSLAQAPGTEGEGEKPEEAAAQEDELWKEFASREQQQQQVVRGVCWFWVVSVLGMLVGGVGVLGSILSTCAYVSCNTHMYACVMQHTYAYAASTFHHVTPHNHNTNPCSPPQPPHHTHTPLSGTSQAGCRGSPTETERRGNTCSTRSSREAAC